MKYYSITLILLLVCNSCLNISKIVTATNVSIVPKPSELILIEGSFLFEFATKSDDGSLFYIGNKLVVDNGGNHSGITRDGIVSLKKGCRPIIKKSHEAIRGSELTV